MKKEIITVQVDYEIECENSKARKAAIQDILTTLPHKAIREKYEITWCPDTARLVEAPGVPRE